MVYAGWTTAFESYYEFIRSTLSNVGVAVERTITRAQVKQSALLADIQPEVPTRKS